MKSDMIPEDDDRPDQIPDPKQIYWERAAGEIMGPGFVQFVAKEPGTNALGWVIVQFNDGMVWVKASVLRSRRAFDAQPNRRRWQPQRPGWRS